MSRSTDAIRVLFVVSECAPFVKTGGLADVAGALPKALAGANVDVRVLMPAYPRVIKALASDFASLDAPDIYGGQMRYLTKFIEGLDLIAVGAPHLYDRPGNPYLGADGADWPDNPIRFAALCHAARDIVSRGIEDWQPDIVHLHDWQTALTIPYLKFAGNQTPCIMTIHNIAFQGLSPASELETLGLKRSAFQAQGVEFYGQINMLKAGLVYADKITTVSPTYARELVLPDFGMGLEGVIATRRGDLVGLLNGIDEEVWNPETDPLIPATYSAQQLKGKRVNRAALEKRFGLTPEPAAPLFCVISRLTRQKGLDLLLECVPRLIEAGGRLAVLGSGDADLETGFKAAEAHHAGRIGTFIGHDEPLSHLMQAGADAILIPSRFEPCGLTQLYGLRYGTLPVVARTGGLADTVIDANEAAIAVDVATGVQFSPVTAAALSDAIDRTCDLFADPECWSAMVRRAMKHPVSWSESANRYRSLYESLLPR